MTNYFVGQGSPLIKAQQQTIAWVGQQVQLQASFFAYMDAFWVLMLLALAAVPLGTCAAQDQARRGCARRPLRPI
jgi:DHA2 family multidrug resistance protein